MGFLGEKVLGETLLGETLLGEPTSYRSGSLRNCQALRNADFATFYGPDSYLDIGQLLNELRSAAEKSTISQIFQLILHLMQLLTFASAS
jgi:hypothetical protein